MVPKKILVLKKLLDPTKILVPTKQIQSKLDQKAYDERIGVSLAGHC